MNRRKITLQPLITVTAAALSAASNVYHGTLKNLGNEGANYLLIALYVASHDNTNSNETYQFNFTSGMYLPSGSLTLYWDLGASIVVNGADAVVTDLMFINGRPSTPTTVVANATVTSVASNMQLGTDGDTRGDITTAVVRHGFIGDFINYTLESGGTSPGPITFEIAALAWS